jgi:PHD/YefM family antitoxin component YafN of YafNO toxin-antitoxin module
VFDIKERYVVDEHGNRQSVLLSIEDYQYLLEELEDLESIRAYDAAKASEDESIPFEQAITEIEQERQ